MMENSGTQSASWICHREPENSTPQKATEHSLRKRGAQRISLGDQYSCVAVPGHSPLPLLDIVGVHFYSQQDVEEKDCSVNPSTHPLYPWGPHLQIKTTAD